MIWSHKVRGDIVLYMAAPRDPTSWIISHFTHGQYTHCEIDMGNGSFVGEHGQGLTVHPGDNRLKFITPSKNVAAGMVWVDEQIAEAAKDGSLHEYGWLDIVSLGLKFLGSTLILRQPGHWDCSDFVVRYLVAGGMAGPLGKQALNPEYVSPNDLARAFGVI
jgi:hypothetical protein